MRPPYLKTLHAFGEIGIVNDAQKIYSKLVNCGKHCMFVSYMNDHAGDTYRLLNLQMKHIWKSCDIKWITTFIEHLKCICKKDVKPPISDKDDNDAVLNYVQATSINLIPADNEDKAAPAPAH